jgi:hypothetical protein
MKLAEALILRANAQNDIESIKRRLLNNAKVQDGEEPSENPEELLSILDNLITKLEDLIKKINKTNSTTVVDGVKTISDLITEKDCLIKKIRVLKDFANAATLTIDRYNRTEIKIFSTVNVKDLQKEIDKLSKRYREIDTKLQECNWTIDLIE